MNKLPESLKMHLFPTCNQVEYKHLFSQDTVLVYSHDGIKFFTLNLKRTVKDQSGTHFEFSHTGDKVDPNIYSVSVNEGIARIKMNGIDLVGLSQENEKESKEKKETCAFLDNLMLGAEIRVQWPHEDKVTLLRSIPENQPPLTENKKRFFTVVKTDRFLKQPTMQPSSKQQLMVSGKPVPFEVVEKVEHEIGDPTVVSTTVFGTDFGKDFGHGGHVGWRINRLHTFLSSSAYSVECHDYRTSLDTTIPLEMVPKLDGLGVYSLGIESYLQRIPGVVTRLQARSLVLDKFIGMGTFKACTLVALIVEYTQRTFAEMSEWADKESEEGDDALIYMGRLLVADHSA